MYHKSESIQKGTVCMSATSKVARLLTQPRHREAKSPADTSYMPACAAIDLFTITLISTRRFNDRPSRVSLAATGFNSP